MTWYFKGTSRTTLSSGLRARHKAPEQRSLPCCVDVVTTLPFPCGDVRQNLGMETTMASCPWSAGRKGVGRPLKG